jgi:AraC-like DNA-binding protein
MSHLAFEASSVDHPAGEEVHQHAHKRGQLSLVLRGTLAISGEEGWWLIPPGLALWIPPNVLHGARYSESSSLLHVRFEQGFSEHLPMRCDPIVVTNLLRELALEAVRMSQSADLSEASELVAKLIVSQIHRPQHGPGLFVPNGKDRRLQLATAQLRADPSSDVTLDELADRVHASARTLARLFVTETGMPFSRWREHLRVVCAVDKLARGKSITQAALELGYRSPSSFTTLFTRVLGMPPRKYMLYLTARNSAKIS